MPMNDQLVGSGMPFTNASSFKTFYLTSICRISLLEWVFRIGNNRRLSIVMIMNLKYMILYISTKILWFMTVINIACEIDVELELP